MKMEKNSFDSDHCRPILPSEFNHTHKEISEPAKIPNDDSERFWKWKYLLQFVTSRPQIFSRSNANQRHSSTVSFSSSYVSNFISDLAVILYISLMKSVMRSPFWNFFCLLCCGNPFEASFCCTELYYGPTGIVTELIAFGVFILLPFFFSLFDNVVHGTSVVNYLCSMGDNFFVDRGNSGWWLVN